MTNMTPDEDRSAAGNRFLTPFAQRCWHPDGTPFSDQDYRDCGMTPLTKQQKIIFARRDRMRKLSG